MASYLFDTNILIYYFNGEMEDSVADNVSELMAINFEVSVISKMEFLGFPFTEQEKQQAIEFMDYAEIIKLNDEIVQRVIDIRQEKKIKLPDAIIAATAMEQQRFWSRAIRKILIHLRLKQLILLMIK